MSEKNFVDYVKICCRSGVGGSGSAHFFRDKSTPLGGPDGGDGGRGGHIIVRGNEQMWTLLPLKYRKHVIAGQGGIGKQNHQTGAFGEDVILDVPIGTVAKDVETGEFLFEISEDGQEYIIARGGRGGKGNSHFKSPTNRAPRHAQQGEEGVEEWKILELKVLADVGLVGFPNAGKSTLLASITAATPKIGNYPFTTLVPNLGIVSYRDGRSFIMADIPGIIEKAHEGKGLGHRFLKHIERNSVLLFVVPADSESISGAYQILLDELEKFNPELLDKQRILGISKCDLIDEELKDMLAVDVPEGIQTVWFSAITTQNLQELKDLLWTTITAG